VYESGGVSSDRLLDLRKEAFLLISFPSLFPNLCRQIKATFLIQPLCPRQSYQILPVWTLISFFRVEVYENRLQQSLIFEGSFFVILLSISPFALSSSAITNFLNCHKVIQFLRKEEVGTFRSVPSLSLFPIPCPLLNYVRKNFIVVPLFLLLIATASKGSIKCVRLAFLEAQPAVIFVVLRIVSAIAYVFLA
jgi:hypothetical protein